MIRRWGLSLGHNIYTPENTSTAALVPDDRPYAAWLYIGGSLQYAYTVNGVSRWLDTLQLDVGILGPAAKGETVQNDWHGLIGVDKTFGWDNQLRNEPIVNLTVERRWRTGIVDVVPEWGLEADIIPMPGPRWAMWRPSPISAASCGWAMTSATISDRRAGGRPCPARKPSPPRGCRLVPVRGPRRAGLRPQRLPGRQPLPRQPQRGQEAPRPGRTVRLRADLPELSGDLYAFRPLARIRGARRLHQYGSVSIAVPY